MIKRHVIICRPVANTFPYIKVIFDSSFKSSFLLVCSVQILHISNTILYVKLANLILKPYALNWRHESHEINSISWLDDLLCYKDVCLYCWPVENTCLYTKAISALTTKFSIFDFGSLFKSICLDPLIT